MPSRDFAAAGRGGGWRVPHAHGEFLCDPPPGRLPEVLQANREQAARWSFEVGGLPVDELRRRARAELTEAALRLHRRWGLPIPEVLSGGIGPAAVLPLVATGHQPIFYHPGIWVKNALAAALARRVGGLALNLWVDHDTGPDVSAVIPVLEADRPGAGRDGRLARDKLRLVPVRYGTPFCHVPSPSVDGWDRFCREGLARLQEVEERAVPGRLLTERLRRFHGLARAVAQRARNMAEFISIARHLYEGSGSAYLELPASAMADTEAFRRLVAHILLDAPAFARAYNAELAAYRERHRLRSRANPFPDLAVTGDRVEVPFWLCTPAVRRRALHVRRRGDRLVLETADGPELELQAGSAAEVARRLAEQAVPIRPKAVTLTLFMRLAGSDLFIHGVGGGRYDQVTDGIFSAYFGLVPPAYAVASAALHLPFAGSGHGDPREQPSAEGLRAMLRDLRFNPQRLWPEAVRQGLGGPEGWALVQQKNELIAAIAALPRGAAGPPGRKRALTRQIEAINAALSERLGPLGAQLQERLQVARLAQQEQAVRQAREYAFFLYGFDEVEVLVREALSGETGVAEVQGEACACAAGGIAGGRAPQTEGA